MGLQQSSLNGVLSGADMVRSPKSDLRREAIGQVAGAVKLGR
jgi:hypothetical protein